MQRMPDCDNGSNSIPGEPTLWATALSTLGVRGTSDWSGFGALEVSTEITYLTAVVALYPWSPVPTGVGSQTNPAAQLAHANQRLAWLSRVNGGQTIPNTTDSAYGSLSA
jgi:hypothetical protein